ncbi:hypothetical protein DCMF_23640 [Candidatus Formimonas warabiya]|uniref:Uncharacterized protein n=1 Tax=Formimonas warabiya TaxID=1761012 RepID=A0A3G1KYQ5_FORW1|nr:hypothetical protein DCMF_23640 [Candidatus Formimonas warabiya]
MKINLGHINQPLRMLDLFSISLYDRLDRNKFVPWQVRSRNIYSPLRNTFRGAYFCLPIIPHSMRDVNFLSLQMIDYFVALK